MFDNCGHLAKQAEQSKCLYYLSRGRVFSSGSCRFGVDFEELAVLANDNLSRVFACLMMSDGTNEVSLPGHGLLALADKAGGG